jgi:hypothetical protein
MTDAPPLAVLPSLPLEERRDLPDTAAIYFVLAADTVLYIGQSVNVRQRWLAHHRLAQLNEYGGCRIAWMTVDDASLLDDLERACIAHFNPLLNDQDTAGGRTVREGELWFNVRISAKQKARLDTWARRNGASSSLVMRLLLQEALDAGRDTDGLP